MSIPSVPADRAARNRPWVCTSQLHHAMQTNHFLDLLDVHGPAHGVVRDDEFPEYDVAGSHAMRMMRLADEFRRQVVGAFARRLHAGDVACVSAGGIEGPAERERERTREAMRERKHMIIGAVVADDKRRLFGRIPLLLRVDVAHEVFGLQVRKEDGAEVDGRVYVAVGVKRRSLEINRNGTIRGNALGRAQAEMWLWNRLLSAVQGAELRMGLLVGLNPKRKKAVPLGAHIDLTGDEVARGAGTFFDDTVWRIARVPFSEMESSHAIDAQDAMAWRVKVVDKGAAWIADAVEQVPWGGSKDGNGILHLAATTSDPRLRPNMKCASMYDAPWSRAKRALAEELRELTMVSGISFGITSAAMGNGIPNDYSHPRATAVALGVTSQLTKTILEMSKANYKGPAVRPKHIPHNRSNWRRLQLYDKNDHSRFDKSGPELPFADERTFYIDFELASPDALCDKAGKTEDCELRVGEDQGQFFDLHPSLPIQEDSTIETLIFMIGCGRVVNGEWQHRVFTSRALTRAAESAVMREWLEYIDAALPKAGQRAILHVWGPEKYLMSKSLRRMLAVDAEAVKHKRHFDIVNVLDVVKTGCVTIQGNLKNSVKSACLALDRHGLLDEFGQRGEEKTVTNGADAMTLGLDAAEVAIREGLLSLGQAPKMREIARYNEADCRDIARVITYLRKHH